MPDFEGKDIAGRGSAGNGIEGKVVAITGAGSGIGAATAAHLAARGALLVLGGRSEERLRAVADAITAEGGTATAVRVDVTRREDLRRLTDAAVAAYGRLDVLVSNAGTMAVSPFDELRQDDWDAMVATHITGLLNGIGAALPVFRRQRAGHFVNVGSTAAHTVRSPQGVYAATKAAVTVLTEGLRQESGPDLRVTLVSPGFTHTEGIGKGATPEAAAALLRRRDEIAMPPSAVASAIAYAIEQPPGVDVGEIVVRPTAQT
ncbi:SDR family oxidoreductase [Streptomyces sp. NPDC047014]|uniref:SDR family oxidoreductase n=1 Tax=Streptomyces sp. NPDC047014 TaxID=3155736 RepID=UPI0033E6DAD9